MPDLLYEILPASNKLSSGTASLSDQKKAFDSISLAFVNAKRRYTHPTFIVLTKKSPSLIRWHVYAISRQNQAFLKSCFDAFDETYKEGWDISISITDDSGAVTEIELSAFKRLLEETVT